MEAVLWSLQIFLAAGFLVAGIVKLTQPRAALAAGHMAYMEDLTDTQAKVIGALEVLAAIGLTVPAATGVLPELTPLAAIGLVLLMIGAIRVHRRRDERGVTLLNVALLGVALYVAVMRFGPQAL